MSVKHSSGGDRERVTVSLVVGGGAACLAQSSEVLGDAAAFFDVSAEIAKIDASQFDVPCWRFALAEGHTTTSLAEHADDEFRSAVEELPTVNAGDGLGQLRGFGELGARLFIASMIFVRFIAELVAELKVITNGAILQVTLRVLGSLAGGTCSGAAPIIAGAVSEALHKATDAVVEIHFEMIGPLTYAGVGERTRANAAAGLVRLLGFIGDKSHAGDVPSMELTELPPDLRKDKPARDALVGQLFQAQTSHDLRTRLAELTPNWTTQSRFGNVRLRRVKFRRVIPREEIAFDTAPDYAHTLRTLARDLATDRTQVTVGVRIARRRHGRPSLRAILNLVLHANATSQFVIETVAAAGSRLTGRAYAHFAGGERVPLWAVETYWATPPETPVELRRRLVTYDRSLESLNAMRRDLVSQLAEYAERRRAREKRVALVVRQLAALSILFQLLACVSSRARKQKWFRSSAHALRTVSDKAAKCRAKLRGVRRAARAVRKKQALDMHHLRAILRRIDAFAPVGNQRHERPLVVAKPLAAVWRSLWRFPELSRAEALRALVAAVSHATFEGLARIADAPSAELSAIVRALITNPAPTPGPWWSGRRRRDGGDVVLVLPPVPRAVLEAVRRQAAALTPELYVVATTCAAAGVVAVELTYHHIQRLNELFTSDLQHGLLDAYEATQRPCFGLNAEQLQRLGIDVNGVNGKVRFLAANERGAG